MNGIIENTIEKIVTNNDIAATLSSMNTDAAKGYRTAAETVTNPELKTRFSEAATQRAAFASELRKLTDTTLDVTEGTAFGKMHESWVEFRALINGGNAEAITPEIARADSLLATAYSSAREQNDDPAFETVLARQHAEVNRDVTAAKNG